MKSNLILVMVIVSIVISTNYSSSFMAYGVDNSKSPVYQCIKSSDPNDKSPSETCCRQQKEKSEDGSGKTVTGLYCVTCPKDGSPCTGPEIKLGELGRMVQQNSNVRADTGIGSVDGNLIEKGSVNDGKDMSSAHNALEIDRNIIVKNKNENINEDAKTSNTKLPDNKNAGSVDTNAVKGNTVFDLDANRNAMMNSASPDSGAAENSQNKVTKDTGIFTGPLDKVKSDANPSTGGVAEYKCEGLKCTCKGDTDCNNMFEAKVCGDIASCTGSGDDAECSCLAG